jgi:DNA-directed RNA polymerase specialized sigma24 family protein
VIEALPDRCREIFELRRVQGVSQRDIAAQLGIAEHVVEAQAVRGLKLILKALAHDEGRDETVPANGEKHGDRQHN